MPDNMMGYYQAGLGLASAPTTGMMEAFKLREAQENMDMRGLQMQGLQQQVQAGSPEGLAKTQALKMAEETRKEKLELYKTNFESLKESGDNEGVQKLIGWAKADPDIGHVFKGMDNITVTGKNEYKGEGILDLPHLQHMATETKDSDIKEAILSATPGESYTWSKKGNNIIEFKPKQDKDSTNKWISDSQETDAQGEPTATAIKAQKNLDKLAEVNKQKIQTTVNVRTEAEKAKANEPLPEQTLKGIDNLVNDIGEVRLDPEKAMQNFVQRMGGKNSGQIRLEIENKLKAKYPNFDLTKATVYAQSEKNQSYIRAQENVNSVIESGEMVKKLIPALQNGNVQVINQVNNWWKTKFGSPAPTNWRTAAIAMAQEFNRAYSDSVVNPEQRFTKELSNLADASSPQQLIGSLDTNLALTKVRGKFIDKMRHPYTKEEIQGVEKPKNDITPAVKYLKESKGNRSDALIRMKELMKQGWSDAELQTIEKEAGF